MIRLTLERHRRGWSQAALARKAGMHPTTISLIESKRFQPGAAQIEKLATALAVRRADAGRLLDEVETEAAAR